MRIISPRQPRRRLSVAWHRIGPALAVCFFLSLPPNDTTYALAGEFVAAPDDNETRENPIDKNTFSSLLRTARGYLNVHDDQFDHSIRHNVVKDTLMSTLGADRVINIPLAVERSTINEDVSTWSGADTILGKDTKFVASNGLQGKQPHYMLLPETIAYYISSYNNLAHTMTARDVYAQNLKTNQFYTVRAKVLLSECESL